MTERTPEGRERMASAMRELESFGYLTRTKRRTPEGRIYTEVDVFEAPEGPSLQVVPDAGFPASGASATSSDGDHPVNERCEKPALPAAPAPDEEDGREGDGDEEETLAGADLLVRVARAEPRLSLGRLEALRLAPLVAEWRRRGASELHIIGSLTAGLPHDGVHHPARFIESRLVAKLPAERSAVPARAECDECGVPVRVPGRCPSCRNPGTEPAGVRSAADFGQVRARGAALARAALRGLSFDSVMPAPA